MDYSEKCMVIANVWLLWLIQFANYQKLNKNKKRIMLLHNSKALKSILSVDNRT